MYGEIFGGQGISHTPVVTIFRLLVLMFASFWTGHSASTVRRSCNAIGHAADIIHRGFIVSPQLRAEGFLRVHNVAGSLVLRRDSFIQLSRGGLGVYG